MIVCQCTGLTDRQVVRLVCEGANSVSDIARQCGAGTCAPCHAELKALVAAARRLRDETAAAPEQLAV